jgi:hypothetical protein
VFSFCECSFCYFFYKLPYFSNEFADALSAQSTSKCDVYVLPTKLRPVKIEDENDNDFEISEESEENIIINLNKLSKLISAFLPHEFQRARPSVKVETLYLSSLEPAQHH